MFYWGRAQAGIQAAALAISIAMAIGGGIFTGLILLGFQCVVKNDSYMEDSAAFHVGSGYAQIGTEDDAPHHAPETKELQDAKPATV